MGLMNKIEDAPIKDKLFMVGVFLFASVGTFTLYSLLHEDEWEKFKKVHECRLLTEVESITTFTQKEIVGPDGAMQPALVTTTIPGKRAFLCDDGIVYWR